MIPMDYAIKEFDKHLNSHPRTFLSARFGDGKSSFLSAVAQKLKGRIVFLTVYPVNYQVADNKDIFEYIKRDILFQLYGKGMVKDSYQIPDSIASYFYLQSNWEEFAMEFLKELSVFDASNTLMAAYGAAKFLQSMKKKYDEFKKNCGDIGVKLDSFITSFDHKGIYEADPITAILNDIIKDWKKEHLRKKVCLVFEDMDRIDPAHIFRILNVISAHMDYGYKYGISPKSNSLAGNKFGVDNIVVCLDHSNLKALFHHFYGTKASFEGYINKFSDKGFFRYSLHEQVKQHYLNELMRVTGMDSPAVTAIMDQFDFTVYTLRQLYHATDDVGKQVSLPHHNNGVFPHRGVYTITAILIRLGIPTDEISSILAKAFRNQPNVIGMYAGTTMMLKRSVANFDYSLGEKENGYLVCYSIVDHHRDGVAFLNRSLYGTWDPNGHLFIKPEEEVDFIIEHVSI